MYSGSGFGGIRGIRRFFFLSWVPTLTDLRKCSLKIDMEYLQGGMPTGVGTVIGMLRMQQFL